MDHRWVELEEFPTYAVNDQGQFVNIQRGGSELRLTRTQQGHAKVALYKNGHIAIRSAALLVAKTFIEQPDPFFNTPIHLNGDLMDCRAENLAWRPRWFAIKFHKQFWHESFHEDHGKYKELNSGVVYHSVREACMALGIYHMDITMSCYHATPVFPGGYYFERVT